MADAEDGELDLVATALDVVEPGEDEERDDEDADDVGHHLVAEQRALEALPQEAVSLRSPGDDGLGVAPGLGSLGRELGQAGVVGGQLGVLVGAHGGGRQRYCASWLWLWLWRRR